MCPMLPSSAIVSVHEHAVIPLLSERNPIVTSLPFYLLPISLILLSKNSNAFPQTFSLILSSLFSLKLVASWLMLLSLTKPSL